MVSEKRVDFHPQKVGVFREIGEFFRLNFSEKGSFFNVENTDGLHIQHWSGGTGVCECGVAPLTAPPPPIKAGSGYRSILFMLSMPRCIAVIPTPAEYMYHTCIR